MEPHVNVPVIVSGPRGATDSIPSGLVPLSDLANGIKTNEGEVVWMSIGRDYRIQLKGTPKRIVGDSVIPEKPRVAQFENHIFKCEDEETNRQMRAAKANKVDFWDMGLVAEQKKVNKQRQALEAIQSIVAEGDTDTMAKLSVLLGEKSFSLPPSPKKKSEREKADPQ